MFTQAISSSPYSLLTDAALALDVYRDADRPDIPEGLTWLCDSPSSKGYFASAYYVTDAIKRNMGQIYIAHRGTVLSFDNLWDDLLIALGDAPRAFEANAIPFVEIVKAEFRRRYPKIRMDCIQHIGHSSGGVIATLLVALGRQKNEEYYNLVATTFDSPGEEPIIKDLMSKEKLPPDALDRVACIGAFYSEPNAINTCNKKVSHGAYTRMIKVGYEFPSNIRFDLTLDKTYWATVYTFHQHKMALMYKAIKNGEYQWNWQDIVGFDNGYLSHRRYYSNNEYWDADLKNHWNNNIDIQEQYKQKYGKDAYDAYHRDMVRSNFPDGLVAEAPRDFSKDLLTMLLTLMIELGLHLLDEFIASDRDEVEQLNERIEVLERKLDSGQKLKDSEIKELKESYRLLEDIEDRSVTAEHKHLSSTHYHRFFSGHGRVEMPAQIIQLPGFRPKLV